MVIEKYISFNYLDIILSEDLMLNVNSWWLLIIVTSKMIAVQYSDQEN